MRLRVATALISLALVATMAAGRAKGDADDHDAVRDAVERGEIRPLADILAMVRGKLPGKVTGVEVERTGGRWIYEFRVIDGRGHLFDVFVDARTGAIDRTREK